MLMLRRQLGSSRFELGNVRVNILVTKTCGAYRPAAAGQVRP